MQAKPDELRREFLKLSTMLLTASFGHIGVYGCSILPKEKSTEDNVMNNDLDDRYTRGWQKLKEIDGDAGEKVIEALKDVAPDLARYTIEFPFGDIYSREGLDLKSREIATIAMLSAMGNAAPQLHVHIHAALNVGCKPTEIIEVIIQTSVYAGFPAALNAASAAKIVFTERGII